MLQKQAGSSCSLHVGGFLSFVTRLLVLNAGWIGCTIRLISPVAFCLQVALVFPNNDPAAFMTAFYGCLLAEVVPVPIEVPLTRKVMIVMQSFIIQSHFSVSSWMHHVFVIP